MSSVLGLVPRLKLYLFGPSKPREIWRTDSETFLRHENHWSNDPIWPLDTYAIYALHQTSLTTGNTRIVEEWRLA